MGAEIEKLKVRMASAFQGEAVSQIVGGGQPVLHHIFKLGCWLTERLGM